MTGWVRRGLRTGGIEASVASIDRPAEGNRKETAIVSVSNGRTVVVQRADDPVALRTETRLARAVEERTTVPVPTVIGYESIDGDGYRVVERVRGQNLHGRFHAADDRRGLARTFGQALAQLHDAFAFDRFGSVVADGSTRADGSLSARGPAVWDAWIDDYARRWIAALPEPLADLDDPLRRAVRDEESRDAPPTPRLFPWDLRPGNALVRGGEIVAVADWGEPLAATAGLGLAKLDHLVADWYVEDGSDLRRAVREGYRTVREPPRVTRRERIAAVAEAVVDSDGVVTRPGYPERTGADAIAFHRDRLTALL